MTHDVKPASGELARRTVRFQDLSADDAREFSRGIERIYDDELDVIVARGAFPDGPLARVGARLDTDSGDDPGWSRPNVKMPVEDLQVLGTDTPATPTYDAPRGASLDAYLESSAKHRTDADRVFESGFDPVAQIQRVLGQFAGGRPVEVPVSADGRAYVPYTLRRLTDGKQIGIHHDYHYPLALYRELGEQLDTRTLISFVATLRVPVTGGELFVYGVTSDTPDVPKLANGFSPDLEAIERTYDRAEFVMGVGDLFLLASGRCYHRVGRIGGPQARVTMGGFLAFDKNHDRVLFWS